ncbi:unnamed protein product [Rotaria sordida]|uniref:RING-CH-type domain-containing protein n=1 Tax=Rotaria sordida TaxID=392033 RepID=A0A818NMV0_9BILA|nr:unnamed protein product [Rotaria sordida]CAF1323203.1 unnamed protein product [Rotaria sordida]CAF3609861.1 unnamed protein product [Rotaria sordida]CAF3787449.1 unnamed protein product [Rotaria sordida]
MASTSTIIDSQINEMPIDKSIPIHPDEEAILPKSNNQSIVETPLIPIKTTSKTSLSSTSSKTSDYPDICRICHCEGTTDEPLISPCYCLGTMQYLHQSCLQHWIKSAGVKSCELCKFEFIMHSEIKPFKQWQKLDMNVVERRKVMCSVAFNLIAVTCVLWSLYVLIEKTREEVKAGKLQWPFWTKLIIVAVGFTGGLIFLYVQCKMYLQLCIRWRQFNQRIVIHSRNEERHGGVMLSGTKNSNNNRDNCIVTVLDANDLPPLNSNTSSIGTTGNNTTIQFDSSSSTSINRNRRHQDNNHRRFLHRFFIFHRLNQSQT